MKVTALALLRGINVGGKNKLAMRDLIALVSAAGGSTVTTFIQSGNVIFDVDAARLPTLPAELEARIAARSGLKVPVIVRTAAELAAVARAHPFDAAADPAKVVVMFLADKPSARSVATLDPGRSPPDRWVLRGREIFLHCPNGLGRSKLSNAYFDSKLATTSTGRNWRTVLELAARCRR